MLAPEPRGHDYMRELTEFLKQHDFPADNPVDGEIYRFDRRGEISGWFWGNQFRTATGKTVVDAECGDWKTNERYSFSSETEFAPEESAEVEAHRKLAQKEREKKALEIQESTSKICAELFEKAHGPNGHVVDYLVRKKIDGFFGAKTLLTDWGAVNLAVPCRDVKGKIWGLQKIMPDGGKSFYPGQRVKGTMHVMGDIAAAKRIYIAEGFATAASIHMATGLVTVVGFNATNLPSVAKAITEAYPHLEITMCADNDQWTVVNGEARNAGMECALSAANECCGKVVAPVFKSLDSKPTDFNDLHCAEGLEAVRDQLAEFEKQARESGALVALPGKLGPAKHQQSATALLRFYGADIVKQDGDLFRYTGTHWKMMRVEEHDQIKQRLQTLLGGGGTASQVESAYRLFLTFAPVTPEGVDLHTPPQWVTNFQNGTLFIVKKARKYEFEFRSHERSDYVNFVLPFPYNPDDTSRNAEFDAMLERVFEGDADIAQKKTALSEMYGASLVPAFPHLFMLYGQPGTGKSTAIILASRLVHRENTCSVDPTEFDGSNLDSMVGKLVNFDTDIEMHKPISEKQIKKIIDRVPFNIKRKYLRNISAPIPAIHIFGGNDIPKTLDGASKAHDRRWTFIGFDKVVAKGNYDVDYADYCFNEGPAGILNFAIAGLKSLLARGGHFTMPDSGREKMAAWQLQTDPIGQFLKDVEGGTIYDSNNQVKVGPTWRIKQMALWGCFKSWHLDTFSTEPKLSRIKFYAVLRDRGYRTVTITGLDHFMGIGVSEVASSQY
jgi:phage/plasmid primase-like uncharacterized protein